jgi:hypothetical protein
VAETLTIPTRFRGPVDSGNGGYSCGIVARHVDAPVVEVTLRSPPPLEKSLALRDSGDGMELCDGETLVAEAVPADELELEIPEPPTLDEASAARESSPMHDYTPYPECFVCGPAREQRDGLQITPGPVQGRDDLLASPWITDDSAPLHDGAISPAIVWAALDCPGGCALILRPDVGVCMLGRLTAQFFASVEPGASYVAIGWPIDRDGRKLGAGTALFTADGELVAASKATWIELKD